MVLTCHLLQPSPARLSWSCTDEEKVVEFYEISSTKGNREAYSQHCGQKARSRTLSDKEGKNIIVQGWQSVEVSPLIGGSTRPKNNHSGNSLTRGQKKGGLLSRSRVSEWVAVEVEQF